MHVRAKEHAILTSTSSFVKLIRVQYSLKVKFHQLTRAKTYSKVWKSFQHETLPLNPHL